MELSARERTRAWTRLSCVGALLLIAIAGCEAEAATTGVRLAIRYDTVPARLRVEGSAGEDQHYGPELLPDPPRALRAEGETLLLALPDALAGDKLTLEVTGLDGDGRVMSRAIGKVRVVKGSIVQSVLQLDASADCIESALPDVGGCAVQEPVDGGAPGTGMPTTRDPDLAAPDHGLRDGSAPGVGLPDASAAEPSLPDAGPLDAGPLATPGPAAVVDAQVANPGTLDAATPDAACTLGCSTAGSPSVPPPDAAPPPPPPGPRCGDGTCQPANGENVCTCAADCGASKCDDGLCCAAAGEDSCSCMNDCGAPSVGSCTFACGSGKCSFDCKHAKSCSASCSGTADCTIKCQETGTCSAVSCAAPATCLLECEGSTTCGFALCPSGAMSCPKNRIACNRPCPP